MHRPSVHRWRHHLLNGDGVIALAKVRHCFLNGDLSAELNGVGWIATAEAISGEYSGVDVQLEGATTCSSQVRVIVRQLLIATGWSGKECIERWITTGKALSTKMYN